MKKNLVKTCWFLVFGSALKDNSRSLNVLLWNNHFKVVIKLRPDCSCVLQSDLLLVTCSQSELWTFWAQCYKTSETSRIILLESNRCVHFTAAPLWFVNAVLAVVSKKRLREKKNHEALNQFHFQKSASFVDRSALTEWIISCNMPASAWASQTFPFPIFFSSSCVWQLSWLSKQSASITLFSLVSRILTNCALFDDCLIIPFHFSCISNSTTPSSFPLRLHPPLFCLSARRRHWDTSDFYWLNTDLVRHACLGAAAPLKPSVCCFLSDEHVAL